MHNAKPSDSLYDIVKPCDYFDMICGTSAGGLIAIMLGRLRMGVQEAIDAYLVLAKNVFRESHPFSHVVGARTLGALLVNARFSGAALTDAIQKIVESKTNSKETLMLDTRNDACKVPGGEAAKEGKYFRFNVLHGLQGISLEEWQTFDQMDAATRTYLDDVKEAIQACCNRLRDPSASLSSPRAPVVSPFSNTVSSNTASLGTFSFPHNSSPYFTSRWETIRAIAKHFLQRHPHNPQTVVLSGLRGIGKTQIALHYFKHHKSSYSSAFFVQCNSEQEAIAAYLRFAGFVVDEELHATPTSNYDEVAKRLGFSGLLTERSSQLMNEAHRRVVKAVGSWLRRQQGKFLVILDNADDPKAMNLTNFIPHHRNGNIIITSRDASAIAFGQLFKIEEMSEDEAVALLSQASHLKLDAQELLDAAKRITETLGYLPLAIDQACGYLVTSGSDIRSFLSSYKLQVSAIDNSPRWHAWVQTVGAHYLGDELRAAAVRATPVGVPFAASRLHPLQGYLRAALLPCRQDDEHELGSTWGQLQL
ncbi:hypothetical protein V500_05581 [Pseudogymnoascus sp. VKM F-4518 (FW-2643)]|nr:hypothetical protein V500_05581 [Pseudogymnoascus sp. VKM F-4518 (FW-2643)]